MSLRAQITRLSSRAQLSFLSERQVYMGLAILMVLTYHSTGRHHIPYLMHIFNYVSGVDIFMFFSGVGLCFSCTRHSLSQFYKNRFLRILPTYIVMALTCSLLYQLAGGTLNVWGYLCNVTTLSYYHLGGCFVDWYLSVLFLFYLLFPLIFKTCNGGGIVALCLISYVIVLLVPMDWTYDSAVSRVGVFLLGILFYRHREDATFIAKSIVVSLVLCIVLRTAAHAMGGRLSIFLFKSFFMPLVIVLFSLVINVRALAEVKKIVGFVGRHTLEIYVGNVLSWGVLPLLPAALLNVFVDLLLTAAFAVVLYYINALCLRLLRRRYAI